MSGNVEVLLGVSDYVLVVEEEGVQRLGAGVGPLQKMAVSQNGKYLASFTHDGRLLVIPTDFSRIMFEYNCESALPPEQLAWCGMDSVLLYWDEMLLMVGPNGEPVRYVYDEPIILIPECDGVRILSNTSMEFLQRVPDSTVSIFQIGSMLPAALLYDALDHFDRRSSKGYAPPNSDRREVVLARKRIEYFECVSQCYDIPDTERSDDEINMLRQIAVDCPRTVPDVTFFQQEQVQKSLERILYTWAIRHPASGYVQGINDLVTPFLLVFLSEHLNGSLEDWLISDLSPLKISNVEADCYWCLSKLLDGMQDHYTFAQPGIQRLVFKLKELVRRIDEPVSTHMEEQGIEFLQFAFRWFNCLLIREIPFHLVTRLWDTYLAEGDALPDFLVYIFASFLLTWSDKLQKLEFQEMVMFLQHLPTQNWTHQELEMVLSRAYMWHTMFNSSPSHLAS